MKEVLLPLICRRVIGWTLLWIIFYRTTRQLCKKKSAEYSCRVVTLFHALSISVTSCYFTFFSGTSPYKSLALPNTNIQLWIITVSLGYFLFDFAWCLYNQSEPPLLLLHHVVSIVLMSVCLYLGESGTEIVATIFGSEVTSIFLNIRWFLKEQGHYNGQFVGFLVDILFVLLFVGVRIMVGGHLLFCELFSDAHVVVKLGGVVFFGINCAFLFQILSFARHRLKTWKKSDQTKSAKLNKAKSNHAENVSSTKNGVRLRKNNRQDLLTFPENAAHSFDMNASLLVVD